MPNNAAKTPGKASKVGRKPNGTLEEMDKDCQIQAAEKAQAAEKVQDEVPGNAEQEASSSKRPAEEQSGPVKKTKKKAKAQEEPQEEESSYGERFRFEIFERNCHMGDIVWQFVNQLLWNCRPMKFKI